MVKHSLLVREVYQEWFMDYGKKIYIDFTFDFIMTLHIIPSFLDRVHLTFITRCARYDEHSQICQPCQEYQEQTCRQNGMQSYFFLRKLAYAVFSWRPRQSPYIHYWTPGSPEGVLSNRPCPSMVRSWSVFKYLGDRSLVFSFFFLHEVRAP